jgi:nitrate reductase beta subunit
LLAVLQLFRATQTIIFRYQIEEGELVSETEINGRPWQLYNDTIIGFDGNDNEVVRVSVDEGIYERDKQYQNSI